MEKLTFLKLIYAANILGAGNVGIRCLFFPRNAATTVFSDTVQPSHAMQILGAFWLTVAILSIAGLFNPIIFSPLLLVQLVYKVSWLSVVVVPSFISGRTDTLPKSVVIFFIIWVVILPFAIPWKVLLQ
jgi:hypothetical protein